MTTEAAAPGSAHRALHRYAEADRRRALFVTGWPADGIDWLAGRLGDHPRIALRPDHDVIATLYNPIARALLGDRSPADLTEQERAHVAVAARRATTMLDRAETEDGAALAYAGSGHPNHAENLMLLAAIFPGARILWIERDPRDATLAYWTAHATAGSGEFRAYAERAMRHLARLAEARADAARRGARLLTVPFERLAAQPADALAGIARWLDLEPIPAWRSVTPPDATTSAAPDPAALDTAYRRHLPDATS